MSTLQMHFRAMARNNLWSNHRLHRACAQLSPEECAEDRGAFFRSILGTLNHILLVDRWYLGRLTGAVSEPTLPHDTMVYADLQSLTTAQLESDRGLMEFCDLSMQIGWHGLSNGWSWLAADSFALVDPW